jgi:hypothetical protein
VTASPRLLVALATLQFTLFPIPITLFLKDQIGRSLADIFLLQAVFGLAVVLLGAFTRTHRGAAVALDGDIRYRPKT